MILGRECGAIFLSRTKGEKGKSEEIRSEDYEVRVGGIAHLTVLPSPVITAGVTWKDKGSPLVWSNSEPYSKLIWS